MAMVSAVFFSVAFLAKPDSITVPFRVVGVQAGRRYLDMTVREVRFNTGLQPAIFAKPSP